MLGRHERGPVAVPRIWVPSAERLGRPGVDAVAGEEEEEQHACVDHQLCGDGGSHGNGVDRGRQGHRRTAFGFACAFLPIWVDRLLHVLGHLVEAAEHVLELAKCLLQLIPDDRKLVEGPPDDRLEEQGKGGQKHQDKGKHRAGSGRARQADTQENPDGRGKNDSRDQRQNGGSEEIGAGLQRGDGHDRGDDHERYGYRAIGDHGFHLLGGKGRSFTFWLGLSRKTPGDRSIRPRGALVKRWKRPLEEALPVGRNQPSSYSGKLSSCSSVVLT